MSKNETHRDADDENSQPEVVEATPTAAENGGDALAKAQQDLLYVRADMENTKKRMLREQEQAIRFGNERLISELLSVVDLFELALGSSDRLREKNDKDVSNYLVGIEMTHKQFIQTLEKMGVEMIGKVGEKFDPSRHEAVSQVTVQEAAKVGTILQVATRGCLYNGRLLKPARVVVGDSASASN